MNPVSYKVPRSIRGLVEVMAALFPAETDPSRKDSYPYEPKSQTPPRRNKPNLTTRGHFINCIA